MVEFKSVKTKLLVLMTLIFLVTVLVISTTSFLKMKDAAMRNSERELLTTADSSAQLIARTVDKRVAEMEFLANTDNIVNGDKEHILPDLERQNQRMTYYDTIQVGDLKGDVYGTKGASGNRFDRQYYSQPRQPIRWLRSLLE